ncbi:MAG: metalloregulator ArsR/SmtB family transcription factor [Bdellovibrionia bacterium]
MANKKPRFEIVTLSALAEPTRKQLVELLRDGPLTVGEIADRLGIRQPQASKHLKVLSDCGILEMRAEANRRIYMLRGEEFQKMNEWAQSFTRAMSERFDKLDGYLNRIQKNKT